MVDDPSWDDEADTASGSPLTDNQSLSPELLELDHIYEALSHPRRRYLCYTLLEDSQWTLTDLATKIAAWENEIPEHAVTEHQHKRVYVSLYHAHIPNLVDHNVITFDDATGMIRPAENADQVLAALEGIGATLDNQQETHARGDIDDQK